MGYIAQELGFQTEVTLCICWGFDLPGGFCFYDSRCNCVSGILIWEPFGRSRGAGGAGVGVSVGGGGGAFYSIFAIGVLIV